MPSETSLKNLDLTLLAQRLGRLCKQLNVEVTAAESCTGGGIASAITEVAGSSAYFTTGYVTYANAAKTRLLGVPETTLAEHGAVSKEVVKAMVLGACNESGAGLAVAVSGVAGPEGGALKSRWVRFGWPGEMLLPRKLNAFTFQVTVSRCESRPCVRPWLGWWRA